MPDSTPPESCDDAPTLEEWMARETSDSDTIERQAARIAELEQQVAELWKCLDADNIRKWWRFDSDQQPLSSYHEREEFLTQIAARCVQPKEQP